jgi:hypothetical protein
VARERIAAFGELTGVWLGLAGLMFTKGVLAWPTVPALAISMATAAVLAFGFRRVRYAFVSGGLLVGLVVYSVLIPVRSLFDGWTTEVWISAGLGFTVAAVLLTCLSAWFNVAVPGRKPVVEGPSMPTESQRVVA